MRPVIENDFLKDEFKGKQVNDYEFREDGVIVRKDRWEMGIRRISGILGYRDFEIIDLIDEVQRLKDKDISDE